MEISFQVSVSKNVSSPGAFNLGIFRNPDVQGFVSSFRELEYLGVFVAGMLFTFGFTTPFAIGFFVVLNPANHFFVALVGGLGAVIGDLLIFLIIRFSFMDEFRRLEKTKLISEINYRIKSNITHKAKLYLLYSLEGLIIASPLPDEAGVIMLVGITKIRPQVMAVISFIFNSLGILVMTFI